MENTPVLPKIEPFVIFLQPRLAEVGKIKLGAKGDSAYPTKFDYFRITTMERDPQDNNNFKVNEDLQNRFGGKKCRDIPIMLMFDSIPENFLVQLVCYHGKKRWCYGDGKNAIRIDEKLGKSGVKCPCERFNPDFKATKENPKCKYAGILAVMIRGADSIGGIYVLRTTSRNSCEQLYGSMALVRRITHGRLAGLDLNLIMTDKEVTTPTGDKQIARVVCIEFHGGEKALKESSYQKLLQNKTYVGLLESVNKDMSRIQQNNTPAEEDADFTEEFFPDQLDVAPASPPATQKTETAAHVPPSTEFPKTPGKRGLKPGTRRAGSPVTNPPVQEPPQTTPASETEPPERRLSNPDESGYVTDLDTGEVFDGHMNPVPRASETDPGDGYYDGRDDSQEPPPDEDSQESPEESPDPNDEQQSFAGAWG